MQQSQPSRRRALPPSFLHPGGHAIAEQLTDCVSRGLVGRAGSHRVPTGFPLVSHWFPTGFPPGSHRVHTGRVQMPLCDGLEATRRIRAFEAASGRRPPATVIALTAHAGEEDKQDCLAAARLLRLFSIAYPFLFFSPLAPTRAPRTSPRTTHVVCFARRGLNTAALLLLSHYCPIIVPLSVPL